MIEFKIGRLRDIYFTREQKSKVQAGIDLFNKLSKSPQFMDLALRFNWTNKEGRKFHRFLYSNGLSNHQVLDKLQNASNIFEEMGMNPVIAILPCDSRKDIANFKLNSNPIIWLSTSCLSNVWFTPIHIASALCHELMTILGFRGRMDFKLQDDFDKCVPYAFGKMIMLASKKWENKITDIRKSFEILDQEGFNYFPASIVFDVHNTEEKVNSYHLAVDNMLHKIEREEEDLNALEGEFSLAETNRLACLKKIKSQLIEIQHSIVETSLDGSEILNVPAQIRAGKGN